MIFFCAHMTSFALPSDYPRIQCVNSFEALVGTRFADGVNALCWQRTLPEGFSEVVSKLNDDEGIVTLDEVLLRNLPVSAVGRAAIDFMLRDFRLLRDQDLDPVMNCIREYPRDADAISTDVYSFHVDSATVEADTYLCTYHGAPSEGLRNEEALRCVDIPKTRAELLKRFGGDDDESFREFLKENSYDLHFTPIASARPFSFGLGNLWRIATEYPGSPVPPCIHRAPDNKPGDPPRLLLIS